MLNINQPSQYGYELDDSLVEVYTWKTGKNPHSSLYQKKNTLALGPVNYQLLEIDIVPEQIACGDEHVMFLTEEKLFAMGENSDGRLGISKRQVRSCNMPTLVHALSSFRVLKVACGAKHTIALVDPGDVFAWGSGADGQLGLRNDLTQFSPQYVKLDRTDLYTQVEEPSKAIDISCGLLHTAVISKNGEIITFGNGEYGQLGNGKRAHEYIPYKVKLQNDKAEKVVCGKYHTVVLSTKGNVYAFGLNNQGQLGIGNRKNCDVPHRVSFPERVKITKISAGVHTAALTDMGQMYVWGPCILGECLTPQRVCRNVDMISDVQIAPNMTSILDFKGHLWTLGSHKPGELGVQSLDARTLGSQVRTLREKKVKSIVCARDLAFIITEKGGQLCNSSYMTARGTSLSPTMKDLNASITGRSFFASGNDTSRDRDGNNTSGISRSGNRSFSTGLIKGTTGILKGWRPTEKALEAFTVSKSSIPTVHTTFHTEAHDMLLGSDNFLSAEFKERNYEITKERRQEYHDEREKRVMLPRVRDAALEEIAEHEHSTSAHEYASESERTHKLMMNYNPQQERELEGQAREVRSARQGDLMDIVVGKRESLREKFNGQFSPISHVEENGTPHGTPHGTPNNGSLKNFQNLQPGGETVKTRELLQKQWSSGINGLKTDETVDLERLISYNNSFNNTQEDQVLSKNASAVGNSEWNKRRSSGGKDGEDSSNEEYVTELKVAMEKGETLNKTSRETSPGKKTDKNEKSSKGGEKSPNKGKFASDQESSSSGQDKSPVSPTKKPPTGKKKNSTSNKAGDKSPQRTPKNSEKSVERRSESQERVEAYERKVQAELGNIKAKTIGSKIRADGKVGINEELFAGAEQSGKEAYERRVQDQIRNYRNNSPSGKRTSQSPNSKRSSLSPSPKSKTSSPTHAKATRGNKKDSSSPTKKKTSEGKSNSQKSIASGKGSEREVSDQDVSPSKRVTAGGGSKKRNESTERKSQNSSLNGKSYDQEVSEKERTPGAVGNKSHKNESYVNRRGDERNSLEQQGNYINQNESYERRSQQDSPNRRNYDRDVSEQGTSRNQNESYERGTQNNAGKGSERGVSNKEIVSGGGNRINQNGSYERRSQEDSPNRRDYDRELSEGVTGNRNERRPQGSPHGRNYERDSSDKDISPTRAGATGGSKRINESNERRYIGSPQGRSYERGSFDKEATFGASVNNGNRNESYERGSQQDGPNRRNDGRDSSEQGHYSNQNQSYERGSQNNIGGKGYERGASRVNQNGSYERRPQDSPNRRGYDGEFTETDITSENKGHKNASYERRSQQNSPNRRGNERDSSEQGHYSNKNESYERRSQGSPHGRSYERDFSDKDASPSRATATGGSKKMTESNERRSQNNVSGQRYERDSREKGIYNNKNESYEKRSFERDFSDKDASPTTAATGSKKINESTERRSQNTPQNTPQGRSYEREFSGKEMTPKGEAAGNEFYERKSQNIIFYKNNGGDSYEHEATPSMGNRRYQNGQGQYFEDQGEFYERRYIDEQGNVRSGSPGNQQRTETEKRSFPQGKPQSQLLPPKGIVLGSNIRDPYNVQGNWQVSSVDQDSQRTGDFESSHRENFFESSSRTQPADLNRLTRKFDPVDAREYTPKGSYSEGFKNSSYLNTKSEIKEPISFGDGNVGAVGANHGEVESLKYVGNGSQRNVEGSNPDSRKNIGGGSTPGSRKNGGSYPTTPKRQSRGELDPNDIPRPFQKERSMSQKLAQADLMDAMAEDESFDLEMNASFVRTHSNLANRISDSPIPKRLNESRMSDIAMDLKTLKMKNSMIESQIEEKNRQIALLEGKVNEIDNYTRLNEKKPSIILSRIDDQGLQFKISPHDTSHRPIPTMDISSIPYSYQDDTMIPTVTKIDAKIRIDSPGKEGPNDDFSIPSDVNGETPPGANGNKNDQNNILGDNGAQENKSLISMVNYMNQKDNRHDNYYDAETPKLRGEEPQNNAGQFGMMAQQRFNSPNLIASDNYQDSENDEALDNTLNLKSFKSSFSSWQVKNFLKEESVKNSAKEKSTTFRTASPLGEFVIAPPPGYKTTKHKGSKSPNKSITKDKSAKTFSEQEESLASKFKKAGKSSSMSYRPEEEVKEEGGKKLLRNNSSTGISKGIKIGQSPANKKTKKKIANLKDSGIGSMPAPGKKGSKSGKLEIKGIFINPEIVKINGSALKASPRPRMSDRSSRKDADDEDEDLGMFLKENAPEEEVRTAGIGKKKLVAKFKKNTGTDKSKIESEDGSSRFFTNSEIRNSVKTQQNSFISNPPRSNENSPKQKKKAPSSIFSQVKSAKTFIKSVEGLMAKKGYKKATTINESSMFLTDKISRIDTKLYEPSDTSSPKIPIPHGSPKDGNLSLGSSPTHSRTPSKSKIGALARLLATSNEDGTGKTPKSALHNSTPKHFSDSYDTIGGYLAVHKK